MTGGAGRSGGRGAGPRTGILGYLHPAEKVMASGGTFGPALAISQYSSASMSRALDTLAAMILPSTPIAPPSPPAWLSYVC